MQNIHHRVQEYKADLAQQDPVNRDWRVKIVPDARPNDDGRWIVIADVEIPIEACWLDIALMLDDRIPAKHHMVAIARAKASDATSP